MIAKNKKGKSFGGCVRYVLNEKHEILHAEGVLVDDAASITRDFAVQRSGRPEIKQPVGHIAVAFSPEDSAKMTNDFMLKLAHEYREPLSVATHTIPCRSSAEKNTTKAYRSVVEHSPERNETEAVALWTRRVFTRKNLCGRTNIMEISCFSPKKQEKDISLQDNRTLKMNQAFDIKELKRFCKREEWTEFGLSASSLDVELNSMCQSILNETFEFDIKQVGAYFLSESLPHKLVLRKLNDNIRRIYKDQQANRKIIISQIKTLLEETCPCWIIKTDIKSFYESIDRDRLLVKFQDDAMLSYYSMHLLRKLFSNSAVNSATGVLRGMNISATLSEIYLRKFDRWIKNCQGVYFYARFVDDIIIFANSSQDARYILKNINQKLEELAKGLVINKSKTHLLNGKSLTQISIEDDSIIKGKNYLEYLGYRFERIQDRRGVILKTGIADGKIKKIKSRITWSFADYIKTNDFYLLNDRIKFLTGNYSIKKRKGEDSDLRAGMFFNYSHLSDFEILEELNLYYRKILFAKNGTWGMKLNSKLSSAQKERLKKYCFKTGFSKQIYYGFEYSRMSEIVSCW